jgi:hypothetical protein
MWHARCFQLVGTCWRRKVARSDVVRVDVWCRKVGCARNVPSCISCWQKAWVAAGHAQACGFKMDVGRLTDLLDRHIESAQ